MMKFASHASIRWWQRRLGVVLASMALASATARIGFAQSQPAPSPLKIGIIGSGNIGGTLGTFWAKAGHEVFFSSRNPNHLKSLVESVGPRARAGTVSEAIAFGDVVLLAVPHCDAANNQRLREISLR